MKKQTRYHSVLESLSQTVVGLGMSFGIQALLYPLLNIPVTFEQNILITSVFFCASLIRQYFIRRFFNKCKNK
jgi:hypothetical protein